MPNPKKRKSNTRTSTRRSHHALKPIQTVACAQCKSQILPHKVCPDCGYYKGKEFVDRTVKADKDVKKK